MTCTPHPGDDAPAPTWADLCGQVVFLDLDHPRLDRMTRSRRLAARHQPDGTVQVGPLDESLLRPGLARANRGLTQLFPVLACDGGPRVECRTVFRIHNLPEPAAVEDRLPAPLSPHLHRFIHEHDLGLIRIGNPVSRAQLIAEVALAFPRASMAIMTANVRAAKSLQYELRRAGVQAQRLVAARAPRRAGRVVVGTFDSMAHSEVEIEKRDILIVCDARTALSERAQGPLTAPDLRGRLYGFVTLDEQFSPLEADRLAATFGFMRSDVPAHGFQAVHVDVSWSRFSSALPGGSSALQVKRSGIWRCGPRNRLIRNFARDALREHCVLVLAESVEHVARLAALLPDWPVRVADGCDTTGLPARLAARLEQGRSRWIVTHLLATPEALQEIRPGAFDVVVWAGGGPGLPPMPPSHLMCPSESPQRMRIIDVADRHHPLLRRWRRSRRRAYEDRSWFECTFTLDPAIGRAASFAWQKLRRPQ